MAGLKPIPAAFSTNWALNSSKANSVNKKCKIMCFSIYFIYQIIYLFNLMGLLARKFFSCVLKLLQDYHFFLTLNKVFDVSIQQLYFCIIV